jgi:hypothetical protein
MSVEDDLRAKIRGLEADLQSSERELEAYQVALGDDEDLRDEIKGLRGFIADVRLGIRDLSEYEDVCGRAWT